jgi:ABC-type nitrate/sulfonate/bicarbonate transport system substrate-binding protein
MGPELAIVNVTGVGEAYDKTTLLLLGQRLGAVAAVIDADTVTFAAPFGSGIDFLERFGLSGGMPTRVSIRRSELGAALQALGLGPRDVERVVNLPAVRNDDAG